MTVGSAWLIAQRIDGTNAVNAFFYPGTIGVLAMLVAYFVDQRRRDPVPVRPRPAAPLWQIVFPLLGIAVPRLHDLEEHRRHGVPVQPLPDRRRPLARGRRAITVVFPGLTRSIGESLAREVKR